jgi:hypothetical protein
MEHKGNGYDGSRMSVNAEIAYQGGEAPSSKWSKQDIIRGVRSVYGPEAAKHCASLSLGELKASFLRPSGWHHTGKYFSRTQFYSFDDGKSQKGVMSLEHQKKEGFVKKAVQKVWGLVSFTEWEGKYSRWRKPVRHVDVAWWNEVDGKAQGLYHTSYHGGKKSPYVEKRFSRKPSKNAKILKELK